MPAEPDGDQTVNDGADRDLRVCFDALKRDSAANTPAFEAVLNRPRVRPTRSNHRLVVVIAVAAVLAVTLTLVRPPSSVQPGAALPAWPQTTESLLVAIAAPAALDWSQLPTEVFDRLPKLFEQEKR